MRLQRYLAQSGVAARRKAEELIVAGRVTVNGVVVSELGSQVDPAHDQVMVDGQAVHPNELFYVLLNKPKGSITAVSDPEGRSTVMEWMPNLPVPIVPVGRLDYYSEGVLLLTNDGELSSALQSPKNHVEKTYHVKIRGTMKPAHLEAMRRGVRLDPREGKFERVVTTRPAKVDRLRAESKHDWLVITLTEGKSRQIHRMVEALGYQVVKLQRVAFAGLDFHGLRVGDARELTQLEVNHLRALVKLPKDERAVARGKWRAVREDSDIPRRAKGKVREEAEEKAPPVARARESARAREGARDRDRQGARARDRQSVRDRDRARGPVRDRDRSRGPVQDRDRSRGPVQDRDRSRGPVQDRDRSRGPAPARSRGPAPARSRGPAPARSRGPAPARGGDRSRGPRGRTRR